MIVTVTLNPAIDLFLETKKIKFDEVLRATKSKQLAGGKGVQVTRFLRILGEESQAHVLVGGTTGKTWLSLANREKLEVIPAYTQDETRINVHIADQKHQHIKVNMPGSTADTEIISQVVSNMSATSEKKSVCILAGSLPPGIRTSTYSDLTKHCKSLECKVFLDSSGEALSWGVAAKPFAVKINVHELSELLEMEISNLHEAAKFLDRPLFEGIEVVSITAGEHGAILRDSTGTWIGTPNNRSPRRAVGAGDSFLAGLVHGHVNGKSGADLLSWALASGTAWAMSYGSPTPKKPEIAKLSEKMPTEPIDLSK